eukprot:10396426-Lingulodinium_polyedra.AAC.1
MHEETLESKRQLTSSEKVAGAKQVKKDKADADAPGPAADLAKPLNSKQTAQLSKLREQMDHNLYR